MNGADCITFIVLTMRLCFDLTEAYIVRERDWLEDLIQEAFVLDFKLQR